MKAHLFAYFFLLLYSLPSESQKQPDCGCSAALRYDIFKLKKDSYSEMLLARDINSENYKDLRQKAGGNVSIFGVEVGGNGENIEQIKNIYNERLRTLNISKEMIDYETITTSPIAYNVYKTCMSECIKRGSKGLAAYIVSENGDQVVIDLFYGGEQRADGLNVTYNIYNKLYKTIIKSNGFKTLYILRKNDESLDIVFSSEQYSSEPVHVNAYRPITGTFLVTYDEEVETPGPDVGQAAGTLHEENQNCGIVNDVFEKVDKANVANLPNLADGYYAWKEACAQGFHATRIGLKISAPTGYSLRIFEQNCYGGCNFTEGSGYLLNTASTAIYTTKAYGPTATFTLKAHTYKIVTSSRDRMTISTSSSVSLLTPPRSKNVFISFKDKKMEMGTSNDLLRLEGTPRVTEGGWKIYDYSILKQKKS